GLILAVGIQRDDEVVLVHLAGQAPQPEDQGALVTERKRRRDHHLVRSRLERADVGIRSGRVVYRDEPDVEVLRTRQRPADVVAYTTLRLNAEKARTDQPDPFNGQKGPPCPWPWPWS